MKINRRKVVTFVILETNIGDIRVWPDKMSMDIWDEKMNDWDHFDEADYTAEERDALLNAAREAIAQQ